MKKKLLSAVLAATMVMGMSLNALAAPVSADADVTGVNGVYSKDLTGSSSVTVPIIEVKVPTALSDTVLNPYSMSATVDGDTSTDQIISAIYTISSKSTINIAVSVTSFTAKPSSGSKAKIATTAPTEKVTDNAAFVYMEMSDDSSAWEDGYTKSAKQVLAGSNKSDIIVLEKAADTESDLNSAAAKEAFFKFGGSLAPKPSKPWSDSDKIDLTIKFSFAPVADAATP